MSLRSVAMCVGCRCGGVGCKIWVLMRVFVSSRGSVYANACMHMHMIKNDKMMMILFNLAPFLR